MNWLRSAAGKCNVNADGNLLKDCDLRSVGDVFLDNYYVGSVSTPYNTTSLANRSTTTFYIYPGANASGSPITMNPLASYGAAQSRSVTTPYHYC